MFHNTSTEGGVGQLSQPSQLDELHELDQLGHVPYCSPAAAMAAAGVGALVGEGVLDCGLLAGERPGADVAVLLRARSRLDAVLAMRLAAAEDADALAFPRPGDTAVTALWAPRTARALSRAGRLANTHPQLGELWLAGAITLDHVDQVACHTTTMTNADVVALIPILTEALPHITPADTATLCQRAALLANPPDPDGPDPAATAFQARALSVAVQGDCVHLSGTLPRVEGELLIETLRATAQTQRVAGDGLTATQRRADALIQLALGNASTAPINVTITTTGTTTTGTATGQATTASGHPLSPAETSHLGCSAAFTPVLVTLLDDALRTPQPLNLGRTVRLATPAQRRALAIRDKGCSIPGCDIPPTTCQVHHITAWETGGTTDLHNLALLCWAHHRQVDLGRWDLHPATDTEPVTLTIRPRNRWGAVATKRQHQ
jgi:hypothetical protein